MQEYFGRRKDLIAMCTADWNRLYGQEAISHPIAPSNASHRNPTRDYLRGMKREEWVAPIPGLPCLTGWLWNVSINPLLLNPVYILRDREFSQVVSNHLRLNLDLVELLSRVDTNDATNHLWDNDHVSEVSLNKVGLLVGLSLLLGLSELLDQTHGLALETTVEPTAGTGMDNITELVGGEIEESAWRI